MGAYQIVPNTAHSVLIQYSVACSLGVRYGSKEGFCVGFGVVRHFVCSILASYLVRCCSIRTAQVPEHVVRVYLMVDGVH